MAITRELGQNIESRVGTSTKWSIQNWASITGEYLDAGSRVQRRTEPLLKKLFFGFSLNNSAVERHFKKRGKSEWFFQMPRTFKDVVRHLQSSIALHIDVGSMLRGAIVHLALRFTNVGAVASIAKYDVNDIA